MNNTLEQKRLNALKSYGILDTPPDGTFDSIVKTVSEILHVPIALVSLVDTDRIWFKSASGINTTELTLEEGEGLCSSAILSDEFYMVEDALKDPRTINNILVKSEFGLQFYAAAPLTTKDGYNLGTLCVIDKKPRTFTALEQNILKSFAKIIVEQMDVRIAIRFTLSNELKNEFMLLHDTKSAICYIPALMEMIKKNSTEPNEVNLLADIVLESSNSGIALLNRYITSIKNKNIYQEVDMVVFDIVESINPSIQLYTKFAKQKAQTLNFSFNESPIYINGDKKKIIELIENLLSNAIKYSMPNTEIQLSILLQDSDLVIIVKDEGLGMNENDIQNAFKRFKKLSSIPTNNEDSSGLGLWICKEICELHNGSIKVESKGKNYGSTFTVTIPLE